jgi:hypothetical protein
MISKRVINCSIKTQNLNCYYILLDSVISGEIDCKRNPNNQRSYLVNINLFENIFHYRIE